MMRVALSTSASTSNCFVCARPGQPWAFKNDLVTLKCPSCGLLFVSPSETLRLDPDRTYASYHAEAEFAAPENVETSLAHLVASVDSYRATGRWLDVGFGEGGLLIAAERQGWDCFGTELSPHALDHGRKRGWTVASDPLQDLRFPPAGFDVVTMIEVLEHLANPVEVVRQVAHWLRPGGHFYLTTPNARSLNRWLLGADWSVLCPPEHLALWTVRGIHTLLQGTGFGWVGIVTEGLNPAEILARLRPGADPREVNRQAAGVSLSQALARSGPRRAAKRAANLLLGLLGIGDTLKVRCVRTDHRASARHTIAMHGRAGAG